MPAILFSHLVLVILIGMPAKRNPDKTRRVILDAAFTLVHRQGFQAAGLSEILAQTKLTKGAFYHHFPTKVDLGYALIDDILSEYLDSWWLDPIAETEDPVVAIESLIQTRIKQDLPDLIALGCPINNMVQEMAPLDAGFHQRLEGLMRAWRKAIAQALRRGQQMGNVRALVDTDESASFILSGLLGAFSQAKVTQTVEPFDDYLSGLIVYLTTLKA